MKPISIISMLLLILTLSPLMAMQHRVYVLKKLAQAHFTTDARIALRAPNILDCVALDTLFKQQTIEPHICGSWVDSHIRNPIRENPLRLMIRVIEKQDKDRRILGIAGLQKRSRVIDNPLYPYGELLNDSLYSVESEWMELFIAIDEQHRRKGYAQEAIALLLATGFDRLNIPVIKALSQTDCKATSALAQKCGFIEECNKIDDGEFTLYRLTQDSYNQS